MKYLSSFILAACGLVLSPTTAFAQVPTPYVLNTAGATFSNPSWQADISIGEPIITTFSNPTNILTQGLLQPNYTIVTGFVPLNPNASFTVYPNPFTAFFSIESSAKYATILLFDMAGKQVLSSSVCASYQVPQLAAGLYEAVLLDGTENPIARFKIVKITE